MNTRDYDLIQSIAQGDEDAFNELVSRYKDKVFSIIYRYLGCCPDAEDLAQEVFIKIWRHAGGFKGKSALSTWVYKIVANHCLNYRMKAKRHRLSPLDEGIPDHKECHEEEYIRKKTSGVLLEALNSLPPRQRLAIILSRFDDCSYREISEILDVSLAIVESLLFRAKENLRKKLAPMRNKGEI